MPTIPPMPLAPIVTPTEYPYIDFYIRFNGDGGSPILEHSWYLYTDYGYTGIYGTFIYTHALGATGQHLEVYLPQFEPGTYYIKSIVRNVLGASEESDGSNYFTVDEPPAPSGYKRGYGISRY